MAKELSAEDLGSLCDRIISKAEDYSSSKLARERQTVLTYYRGEAPDKLHPGDSSFVSRDVYSGVDTARSNLVETFSAHQKNVFFRAEKGDTIADAKQATEYCRHVFYKQNNGEEIIYTSVTDGLMNRFSVAKVYFCETTEDKEYEFEALTEEELDMFVSDMEDFEFKDVDNKALAQGLYTGTCVEKKKTRKIKVEVIQPEDLRVIGRSSSLFDSKAVLHLQEMTRSQLIAQGYDKKKIKGLTYASRSPSESDYEKSLRHMPLGHTLGENDSFQEATEIVLVYEIYAYIDMHDTGVANLWKVVYAGGTILDKEQISRMPFASFVPLPIPHTFAGDNYAKNLIPIQNARTVMTRQIINHTVRSNNDRMQVLNGTLHNPKELLDNRYGGIVNVKRMDGLAPLPLTPMNPFVFETIKLLEEDQEEVSGISKMSQGLNKDAVSTQNAEGKIDQLIQLSQQRQKTMARRFGMFMRELWHLIYHTAVDHIDEPEFIQVTGQYVEINPSDWQERTAASIELVLSTSEQEAEARKYIEMDQYFSQHPKLQAQYTPEKQWEVLSRASEKRGIEDLEALLLRPEQVKPAEPSKMEQLQEAQLEAQVKLVNAQAETMIMKAQTDKMRAELEGKKFKVDMADKMSKADLAEREFEHEKEIDWAEIEAGKAAEKTTGIFSANS